MLEKTRDNQGSFRNFTPEYPREINAYAHSKNFIQILIAALLIVALN